MAGTVRAEKEGPIGWLVFDHPERRNAISARMWEEIPEAIERLAEDEEIRVIVLRGAGEKAFVSGADVSEFSGDPLGPGADQYAGRAVAALEAIAGVDKPVMAMIHGFCFGGGVALAVRADLRYAADDARFCIPAARLGVGYHWAMLEPLIAAVGESMAKEILFTARRYDAGEALRMGLVNAVFPKAELERSVRMLAGEIADNAPLTVRTVKRVARELARPPAERSYEAIEASLRACFESEDYREGVAAFLEKRRPRFRGR
ncbi:MAG: enoyl-CoA hydratase [Candidatus Dadabacteria bacterium]|nr:MAG: enoyl-CoA hydratase [Candidatus Dadabacteria bacterium]